MHNATSSDYIDLSSEKKTEEKASKNQINIRDISISLYLLHIWITVKSWKKRVTL